VLSYQRKTNKEERKLMRRILTSVAVLGLVLNSFGAAQVGKPAPEFNSKDTEGKDHSLSDYKGKIVVLEAINMDCPYVKNHYKSGAITELQSELTGKGVVWFVVNSAAKDSPAYRTPEKAQEEAGQTKATAWISDSSGKIGKAYGMRTTPHMFVIDPEGNLAYQGAIDDNASPKGDPRKAKNYVREAVQKIQSGQKPDPSETKPYGCGIKY
jgi:peroxiredoxin